MWHALPHLLPAGLHPLSLEVCASFADRPVLQAKELARLLDKDGVAEEPWWQYLVLLLLLLLHVHKAAACTHTHTHNTT